MWIKINTRNSTKKVVFLPHALVNLTGTQQNIHFGNKKALAQIKYHNNYEPQSGFSPENPFSIIISSALQKKLLIPDAPIYRLKIEKKQIHNRSSNWFFAGKLPLFTPAYEKI